MALRIQTNRIRRRLKKLGESAESNAFKPELMDYTRKVLETCVRETPVRSVSLIERNQKAEYQARINYIPSVHWKTEPRMIVNESGVKLVAMNGRWYAPEFHHVPEDVFAAFSELDSERNRRMQTPMGAFVNHRKQARFLYRRSWWEVAQSLQLALAVSAAIVASRTRRRPPVNPPKAYAQIRGGKETLSVVVFNPFLEQQSRYKPFSGRAILSSAISKHRKEFLRTVENKVRRLIYAAKKIK